MVHDTSGYESDKEPGYSWVEIPSIRVANIKDTTHDSIGGWKAYMENKAGMVMPKSCCAYDERGRCQGKISAGAHIAMEGKDNLNYHRIVPFCSFHNRARHGDWSIETAHEAVYPYYIVEGTEYLKIKVNWHFGLGSEEWWKYIRDNLEYDKKGNPRPIRRSKGNPVHCKQSRV